MRYLLLKEEHTYMWTISATARTSATASSVWAIYCDFANWHRWDYGLAQYQPDGPFITGTTGKLQPVEGPELPFKILHVKEGHSFVDRTPIGPEHAIIARHELHPLPDGTQITHTIDIDGPDAERLAQEMAFTQEELYETVSNLARYAEENHHN
ncbi:SRPBCC family protein [Bacillus sp. BRMEA1]|uniref:SRPBCC family protein n=1 Tax=Neobacillus endophyticus TaxID=2738405 RepID=UPI001567526E|nr:SRPBCC family protein [Neobacillus endophyticus]NRD80186.1 SRPBCC family protein [Neobacillus endophyticus]